MKNVRPLGLIRFSIFISVYFTINMLWITEIKAQDWNCSPAQTNISIPNNTANLNLSENSVAVHPLKPNIILSANNRHNPIGVSAYVSTDWGVTWNSPFEDGIIPNSWSDPAAGIDLNGYLYVAFMGGNGIRVARSTDLGISWISPVVSNNNGSDKPHLKIDNSCISPFKGRIYCAWDYTGIQFTYSSNSGANWSTPPITLPNSSPGHGVNITTDNSGNVYVVWPIQDRSGGNWNTLGFTKSTNGGVNWSTTPPTISLQYTARSTHSGIGPSMAVNMQDNTLYLVYSGIVGTQYDVFMKKSNDGGLTWSVESRVNQVQTGWQTFPWISCDPMSGYLACIYYDSREGVNNAYVSISTNAGNTWCDMRVSTVAVENATGRGSDYIGIEFNKGIVYPIWTRYLPLYLTYRTQIYPFEVIPKNLNVQNAVYYGNTSIQSANTLTSSNITISMGANVTFRSRESITLNPGFTMGKNSTFTAELFYCDGYNDPENIVQINQVEPDKKDNTAPLEFSLSQNYPNPFNPSTLIKYSLKEDTYVSLIIYNILGQEVKRLIDTYENAGYKYVIWDGNNNYGMQVASGIYFYKITAHQGGSSTGDFIDQKKMVIIR